MMRRLLPTAKTTLHPAYDPEQKVLASRPAIRRPHRLRILAKLSRDESIAVMADTVMESLLEHGHYQEAADVAAVILKHYPADIDAIVQQGSAYGHMLDGEFERRYPNPSAIPMDLRPRYEMLVAKDRKAFETAEALGWTPTT